MNECLIMFENSVFSARRHVIGLFGSTRLNICPVYPSKHLPRWEVLDSNIISISIPLQKFLLNVQILCTHFILSDSFTNSFSAEHNLNVRSTRGRNALAPLLSGVIERLSARTTAHAHKHDAPLHLISPISHGDVTRPSCALVSVTHGRYFGATVVLSGAICAVGGLPRARA